MDVQNLIKVSDAQYKQIIEALNCKGNPGQNIVLPGQNIVLQPVGNKKDEETDTKEKGKNEEFVKTMVISKLNNSNSEMQLHVSCSKVPGVANLAVKEQEKASGVKACRPVQDINTVVMRTVNSNPATQQSIDGGNVKTIVLNNSGPVMGIPVTTPFKSQMSLLNTNANPTTKMISLFPSHSVINTTAAFSTPAAQSIIVTPAPIVVTPGTTPQLTSVHHVKPMNTSVTWAPQGTVQTKTLYPVSMPTAPISQIQSPNMSAKGIPGTAFQPINSPGSVTMPLKAFINLLRPKLGKDNQTLPTGFRLPGAEGQTKFVLQKQGSGASYSLLSMPTATTNKRENDLKLPSTSSGSKASEGKQMECFILGKGVDPAAIANPTNQAITSNSSSNGTTSIANFSKVIMGVAETKSKDAAYTHTTGADFTESLHTAKKKVIHVIDESSIPLRGRPRISNTTKETKRNVGESSVIAKKNGSDATVMEINSNIVDMLKNIKEECRKNNIYYPTVTVDLTNNVHVNVAAYENEIHGKKEAPVVLLENKSTMPCSEDIFVSTSSTTEEKKSINIKKGNKYFSAVPLIVEEHELNANGTRHTTLCNSNYHGDTIFFSKPNIKKEPRLGPHDVDYPPSESEEEEEENNVEVLEPPAKRRKLEDDRYACYLCHYIDNSMIAILQHFVEKHMDEKMFVCQYCVQSFFTTSALEWHLHMKHGDLINVDEKEFTVTMKSSNHYKAELELQLPTNEQLFCMREKRFFFPADELYRCNVCSFKSWYRQRIEEHIRFSHNTVKAYKCRYCEKASTNVMEIRKHQFRRHPLEEEAIEGNPALMFEATKETQTMYSVIARRGKSSFKVKKDWWTKYGYEEKVCEENQDEESHFVCKKCAYSTCYEHEMVLHMRIIHNLTTTITCCHCTRVIHTTPEEMIQGWAYCPECMEIICSGPTTYGLPKPRDLSASKENQEGADAERLSRVFGCQLCTYRSEEKSAVNRHLKYKHMNVKPFECPYCEYGSVELGKLYNHMGTAHPGLPKTVVKNESYAKRFEEFKERYCVKMYERKRVETDAFVHLENAELIDGDSIDLLQDIQSSSNVGNVTFNLGDLEEVQDTNVQDEVLCQKIAADLEVVRQKSGQDTHMQTKVEMENSEEENDFTSLIKTPNLQKPYHKDNFLQQPLHKSGFVQTLYGVKSTKKNERTRNPTIKNGAKMSTPLATVLGRRTELHKSLLGQHHFKCKVCPYRCKDRSSMTRHVKYMHFKAYPHSCPYCAYCNVEKTKVKLHVRATHANLPTVVQTNQNMITALTEKIKAYYIEKEGNQEARVQLTSVHKPKHTVQYLSRTKKLKQQALHTLQNGEALSKKHQPSSWKASKTPNSLERKDNISDVTSVTLKLDYMKKKLQEDKELLGTLTSAKDKTQTQSQSLIQTGSEEMVVEPTDGVLENEEELHLLSEDVSEQFTFEELSPDEDELVSIWAPLDSKEIEMEEDK